MRVLIGEDSVLAQEGILRALEGAADIDVIGVFEDADSLRAAIDELRPDVVLTDIRMPPTNTDDGIRLARELRDTHPDVGVVVLSSHAHLSFAQALFERGTARRGYIIKEHLHGSEQLQEAVRAVGDGRSYVDPSAIGPMLATADGGTSLDGLTPREMEVLRLMAAGASNSRIAHELGITVRGVERHINLLFARLDLLGDSTVNRRVVAVLKYLEATAEGS